MKKVTENKMVSMGLFLIGIVLLIESAATMFVLLEAPQVVSQTAAAWVYVLIKTLVSLFVILAGFVSMKKS